MKIIEIVATRCKILSLNCTKFQFRLGLHQDTAVGTYNTPSDTLAVFKGAFF